jgi:hypothetical protein
MGTASTPFSFRKNLPEILCLSLITLFYGYFTSYGSWDFFEPDPKGQGAAYDDMAESLLQGKTQVQAVSIPAEIFLTHSGVQMYFGPWPALARIPLNALFPDLEAQWARASVLCACLLSMAALFILCGKALEKNPALGPASKRFWRLVSTTALCLGSPLLFLSSTCAIYHEAIAWGLASTLWSITLAGTPAGGIAAGIALLSRLPFGIVAIAFHGTSSLLQKTSKARILALLPVAAAILFQAWVNTERFGAPWTFAQFQWYDPILSQKEGTAHPALTQGNIHLGRIPDRLNAYFLPHAKNFSSQFPFVELATVTLQNPELTDWMEPTLPLTLSSPALLAIGLAGILLLGHMIRPKAAHPFKASSDASPAPLPLLAGLLACLFQSFLILSFFGITPRYTLEFLPLLCLLTLTTLANPSATKLLKNTPFKALVATLLLFSLCVNTLTSYAWLGTTYVMPLPLHRPPLHILEKDPHTRLTLTWTWRFCPPPRKKEIEETIRTLRGNPPLNHPKPNHEKGRP